MPTKPTSKSSPYTTNDDCFKFKMLIIYSPTLKLQTVTNLSCVNLVVGFTALSSPKSYIYFYVKTQSEMIENLQCHSDLLDTFMYKKGLKTSSCTT